MRQGDRTFTYKACDPDVKFNIGKAVKKLQQAKLPIISMYCNSLGFEEDAATAFTFTKILLTNTLGNHQHFDLLLPFYYKYTTRMKIIDAINKYLEHPEIKYHEK